MKKLICALALPLALPLTLAGCAAQTLDTDIVPAASFTPLDTPGRVYGSPGDIAEHYLQAVGRREASELQIGNYPGGSGDRLLLFTAENLEDDSVEAMQWRVLVDQTDIGLRVISAGVRQRCARSGSDQWTNSICP